MSKFTEIKNKHKDKLEDFKNHKRSGKINKKRVLPIIFLLVVIISTVIYFTGKDELKLIGEVESTIVSHNAEVSGKILEMPVELGQHVVKGDVIAVIDSTNQDYALEQLELTLAKKKLALADIQVGVENNGKTQAENSISIAQANYNSANAAYSKAYDDYTKALDLHNEGAISKDALDNAKLKADSASNAASAARAQLDNATSQSNVESMTIDIAQIQSQLQQMRDNLEKYTIIAACNGIVMSKSYVIGDMISTGYNMVDIAAETEKYLVFYLPKENLNAIDYNQELPIKYRGEKIVGKVKFIDVKSEYTPKDLQTAANKNKDSVKIKVLLPAETSIKPGEEADIYVKI